MPLKSMAQLFKLNSLVKQGKLSRAKFNEFVEKTPNVGKLPYRVKKVKASKPRSKSYNKKRR